MIPPLIWTLPPVQDFGKNASGPMRGELQGSEEMDFRAKGYPVSQS